MQPRRRLLVLGTAAVASALVLAACGGGGNDSKSAKKSDSSASDVGPTAVPNQKSSASATKATGTAAPAPSQRSALSDINATPRDQVKDAGTATFPIDQFSTQWNYNQTNGPEAATASVITTMTGSPFTTQADGTLTADPNYVASFKLKTTPKQVVTLELNPKAVWSDGKKITAADYIAQWKALSGKNPAYQIASTTGYDQIGSVVQGKSPTEVVVTFASTFGDWKTLFSPLYPAAVNNDPKTFNSGLIGKLPSSSGPFVLQKLDKSAQTVTVKRNPTWWGDPGKLDSIVFRAMDRTAEPGAFVNGETDELSVGSQASNYKQAKGVKDVVFHIALGANYTQMTFNAEAPVLKDARVRQAIVLGIDNQAIANSQLKGLPIKPILLKSHFYLPGQQGYADNAGKYATSDADAAGKLLEAAGWKTDGQYRKKDGKTLEVGFTVPNGNPVSDNIVTVTTALLQRIGVKLNRTPVDTNKFFDDYVFTGQFDMTGFQWGYSSAPASQLKSIFQRPTKGAGGKEQIYQNFSRLGSKQIDGLLNKAIAQTDPLKAAQSLNAADKIIYDEAILDPIYLTPNIVATKKNLCNYGATTFAGVKWADVGFHK